jgi:hypothetical protein
MRNYIAVITASLCLCCITNLACADTTATAPAAGDPNTPQILSLKAQLFNDLDSGDILAGSFDPQTEINIAKTQLGLAQAYMNQGDRKIALILGILARKTMQRALGDPYNAAMIPIYSILVQLYDSEFDEDNPNANSADKEKSKLYREAIDHIHAM